VQWTVVSSPLVKTADIMHDRDACYASYLHAAPWPEARSLYKINPVKIGSVDSAAGYSLLCVDRRWGC
jgi:hypothetical protein